MMIYEPQKRAAQKRHHFDTCVVVIVNAIFVKIENWRFKKFMHLLHLTGNQQVNTAFFTEKSTPYAKCQRHYLLLCNIQFHNIIQ